MSWFEVGIRRTLTDWLVDPQRRAQVWWRCVESWGGGWAILLLALLFHSWLILTAWLSLPLFEWLLYEFLLEPFTNTRNYWEGLPRLGTTFRRW